MVKFKNLSKKVVLIFSFAFFLTLPAMAQEEPAQTQHDRYKVILKSGTILRGEILEKTYEGIKIKSDNFGELFVPLDKISRIKKELSPEKRGEIDEPTSESLENLKQEVEIIREQQKTLSQENILREEISERREILEKLEKGKKEDWFPNPNDTRLFFAPTARPLKKGNGYIQNIDLFVMAANYGITDNISIGGMASLIPGLSTTNQILAFTPKFGMEISPDFNIGGGLLYANGGGLSHMGLAYVLGTYGSTDTNLTLALGGGYGSVNNNGSILFNFKFTPEDDYYQSFSAMTMLGGMHRIFEGTALISENWLIASNRGPMYVFAYGFRFFNKSVSFDIGILYPLAPKFTTYPLPYIDFVFDF